MKKLIISLLFITNTLPVFSQSEDLPIWLIGSWQNIKNGSIEEWKLSDQLLKGKVYKLNETDTIILELLSIEQRDDILYYIAEVNHNPAPVPFKISISSDGHFVCQNPEHDFPKQIEYHYENNLLTVIISDGSEKKMGFQFKKIE